jgi:hypothetical protein
MSQIFQILRWLSGVLSFARQHIPRASGQQIPRRISVSGAPQRTHGPRASMDGKHTRLISPSVRFTPDAHRLHSANRPSAARSCGARSSGDLTDVVGNVPVALAQGLGRAGGGVLAGLMLHLGVELCPEQDDEGRDPEPH